MSAFLEQFVEQFVQGLATTTMRVPLHCKVCNTVVARVHPPAPPVPITCSQCREVTA